MLVKIKKMRKKLKSFTFKREYRWLIFLLLILHSSFSYSTTPAPRLLTIVIDAGHGGQDGGASGSFSKEKDVALKVALLLGKTLEEKTQNVKIIYTRSEDFFVPLYERIGIANRAKADLFISIHCNSMPHNSANRYSTRGVETFVSGYGRLDEQDVAIRENASILMEKDYKENYEGYDPKDPESIIILSLMKNAFRRQSIKLASLIQQQYVNAGRIDRGVQEKSLAVLAKASMPSVLTEIGFISNYEEEEFLNSENGQTQIVENLVNAIQAYKLQLEIN